MDASVPITANVQVINTQPPQSLAIPVNSMPPNTSFSLDILRKAGILFINKLKIKN